MAEVTRIFTAICESLGTEVVGLREIVLIKMN